MGLKVIEPNNHHTQCIQNESYSVLLKLADRINLHFYFFFFFIRVTYSRILNMKKIIFWMFALVVNADMLNKQSIDLYESLTSFDK